MPSDRPKRPHGTFTPAATIARVLAGDGYPPFRARRTTAFGGHRCRWDAVRKVVEVGYWPGDDTPPEGRDAERREMLACYEAVLTAKGKRVERAPSGYTLTVHV